VYVVGVGTTTGGIIPDPFKRPPIRAALDRKSLGDIARIGGGQYFEIGRESDRTVATRIISSIRRRIPSAQVEENTEELYWWFLFAAAVLLCCGAAGLTRRIELWWLAGGVVATAFVIGNAIR
jgi:hypothetical protein